MAQLYPPIVCNGGSVELVGRCDVELHFQQQCIRPKGHEGEHRFRHVNYDEYTKLGDKH